jgi:putative transposase
VVKNYTTRQQTLASCPPIELWPTVEVNLIQDDLQEAFNQRCDAVKKYVDGLALAEIEEKTGIARNRVTTLVKKCLRPSSDGRILGFRGLIPFLSTKKYVRKAPVKAKFPEAQGGMSGVFRSLLNKHPSIEEKLVQYIKKKNSPQHNVHEKRIRAKDLHGLIWLKVGY